MYKSRNFSARKSSPLIILLAFLFSVLFSIVDIVNAQNVPDPSTVAQGAQQDTQNSDGSLTAHGIVVGVILIVTGVIYCFFGKRVYRLTLFLIGFYIGAIAMWIALSNNEPPQGFGGATASPTIILLVSLAAGLILGMLFVCCAEFAIWLLGALAGYLFALFVLSWASNGVIQSKDGRIIFIIVCTTIGLLLTCCFFDTIIIVATAFIGAYAIILGADMFARTGFSQSVVSFLNGNTNIPPYETNTKIYVMLAALVVIFIIGVLFQLRSHNEKFWPGGRPRIQENIGQRFKNVSRPKPTNSSNPV
ncbi:10926_t:CDS:2 [Dentiscutata erythropus]|uniref:Transmembrane protein 198 n=1 Tax=Dentiscutata erythropus TaxID=1348616 RepID=A0A9N8VT86_9GLOM|nr:10926_t:CDS:2 [Dentiscutata erythropus]